MFDPIINAKLNKLLDGGGYSEPGKTLWKGELQLNEELGKTFANFDTAIGLKVGETYSVILDSGTHTCVCKDYDGLPYFGNLALIGINEDTGEVFCVINEGEYVAIVDANNGTHATLTLPETIHPIDPKYLPGTFLPVKEISTTLLDAELEEGAYFQEGVLFGLKAGQTYTVKTDSGTYTSVCKQVVTPTEDPDTILYIGNIGIVDEQWESTGENYVAFDVIEESFSNAADTNGGTHMTITEAVKALAPEANPGVQATVNITYEFSETGTAMTEDECADMDALVESGIGLIVVMLNHPELPKWKIPLLMALSLDKKNPAYLGHGTSNSYVLIKRDDGLWYRQIGTAAI